MNKIRMERYNDHSKIKYSLNLIKFKQGAAKLCIFGVCLLSLELELE